ncbi:hypothetical protein ACSSS7_005991 [Eimeria intestinalis]
MPGIYSKPPRRAEFAADMRCIVEAAAASFTAGEDWTSYVSTLVDELEKERGKARQEVSEEGEGTEKLKEEKESPGRKTRTYQQLVARKEIEVAEVFFECGIHSLFCNVVERADPSVHPAVFEQILRVYEVYQLIEVDPFDDDMGLVSLLNFFLSERHSYYVDIHWRENELSYMQEFISSFLKLVSFRANQVEPFSGVSTQSTASESSLTDAPNHNKTIESTSHLSAEAARLLHACLWTFPPHRVVSRMALSFSRVKCAELLRAFSFFSIGNENVSLLEVKLLQEKTWEFKGILLQVYPFKNSRDAQLMHLLQQVETVAAIAFFGVGPALTRKAVRAALSWSCSSFACRDERCPCSSCEFHRRLLKLLRCRDELGVQSSTEAKRQICFSLVRANVTGFLDQALRATPTANTSTDFLGGPSGSSTLLRVVLHLSLKTNNTERQRLMQLSERQLAQISSCLCSKLKNLSPSLGYGDSPEAQIQGDVDNEQGTNEASSSPVPANDASLDPKEKALTSCLLLFGLTQLLFDNESAARDPSSPPVAFQEGRGSQQQHIGVSGQKVAQTAEACQALMDIYEYLSPRFSHLKEEAHASLSLSEESAAPRPPVEVTGQAGFDPREFFLGIVGIMALLMGSLSLQGVEPLRWRFIQNPLAVALPASAGGMASSARTMLAHYKKTQEEGCEIVKKLGSLVVLRSEQAAGMVLRTKTSSGC